MCGNNLSNNLYKAAYTDDIFITTERPMFVYWDGNTKNTPYKSGLTSCTEGFAFSYGAWAGYMTVVCFVKNDSTMWIWSKSRNAWVEYAAKSDLNAKTPTCQERHMTADTQTLSSDSATTLGDSEITIPFDCIMIGNWKVLCKSSDANASFYYMVNTAYVQGRVQWDGTVQADNTVNIFVMNRFTKGQKLSVSVQGNCSVRGNNTSLTRYTFTFIPV